MAEEGIRGRWTHAALAESAGVVEAMLREEKDEWAGHSTIREHMVELVAYKKLSRPHANSLRRSSI